MAYTKTTWANGDTINATKLNNMENGIETANSGFVTANTSTWRIDKSYNDLLALVQSGILPICTYQSSGSNYVLPLDNYNFSNNTYFVQFSNGSKNMDCYSGDATSPMVID